MSIAEQYELVSIEEYLRAEQTSSVRHEYIGGVLYAMSGGRNVHNLVATNTTASLWSRLRGSPCKAYNSDTKIRIRHSDHTRFYYPDVSVVCTPNHPNDLYQDQPALIVEVLSESTRRVDMGEKAEAYLTIPSLEVYLMIEPELPLVIVHRRQENGFQREVIKGKDSILALPEIGVELPLEEIYDGVEL
ncbi:MAG: Uma2 family endonuclease [Candidatus Eremiobacteraeota bacterium]|nr:Uma2 family endonuclease [Candidatus Eremiobacteraeota bacterium]